MKDLTVDWDEVLDHYNSEMSFSNSSRGKTLIYMKEFYELTHEEYKRLSKETEGDNMDKNEISLQNLLDIRWKLKNKRETLINKINLMDVEIEGLNKSIGIIIKIQDKNYEDLELWKENNIWKDIK